MRVDLDRLGSVFVAAPLIESGLLRVSRGIPILMYHSISTDPETGVPGYYRLATSPARFRAQMIWLHEAGYRTIDLTEMCRRLAAPVVAADRAVVITFDDGFRDFHTHAWPVLDELGFSATMFLPTSFIGSTRRRFKGRDCLTWTEVRALHQAGARFGAHTVTHPVLHQLGWADIHTELHDGKRTIEDELGVRVDAFAYPYAFPQEDRAFVSRFRDELGQLGYAASVTTAIGIARRPADALALKRLPVNDADDLPLFAAKLRGGYDWVRIPQSLFRRAKRLGRIRSA